MAKTTKNKKVTSSKKVATKNVTSKTDNVLKESVIDTESTSPKLVDENNNILYNPEEELKAFLSSNEPEFDIKISKIADEGLEALKEMNSFEEMTNTNHEEAVKYANENLSKLEDIAKRLQDSIDSRSKNIRKMTWNGVNFNL